MRKETANRVKHAFFDTSSNPIGCADGFRLEAMKVIPKKHRSKHGQFFTPSPVSSLLAKMFSMKQERLSILDAGAGAGALTAAFTARALSQESGVKSLHITAVENEPVLVEMLKETLSLCREQCKHDGVKFTSEIIADDFLATGARMLARSPDMGELFEPCETRFDCAILNPPYKKLNSSSDARRVLGDVGIDASNLYAGFLWLAFRLLKPGGELVAITPRSFCNGPYFRPFREAFLKEMSFKAIHVFNSRSAAFGDDEVLQENIIFRADKTTAERGDVLVTSSDGPEDETRTVRKVSHIDVFNPRGPQFFINLPVDGLAEMVSKQMAGCPATLEELGISVSTGRVVDFRVSPFLRDAPEKSTVPLIYPMHFRDGFIHWPRERSKNPNAIVRAEESESVLVDSGYYALCNRFSAKEEKRRIVAAVYDPGKVKAERVGFENHLNYFHEKGIGLSEEIAKGLVAFLNSTLADQYFRQFSGHTQVNATDLRSLRYPSREQLTRLGNRIGDLFPKQVELDELIRQEVTGMDGNDTSPIHAVQRIDDAMEILKAFDVPKGQLNERSALTLLAVLNMTPDKAWNEATSRMIGITPIMSFIADEYHKTYAPNTRETIRRFTMHQFIHAGFVVMNPDKPDRPPNSPKTVYEIESTALKLIRSFTTDRWAESLEAYLGTVETLRERYRRERKMTLVPVTLPNGDKVHLSGGGQNPLIKAIVEQFCARFTPGGNVAYIGDARKKWVIFEKELLSAIGVTIDEMHGKMPDVVVFFGKKGWLLLIEAVTSHGPVDPKRRLELMELFKGSTAGLVFVTAFESRHAMAKYLGEISWETEVWCAESPTHLIHFNGERFLGPY
jgi:adenine-specific DNA-methyltransferase